MFSTHWMVSILGSDSILQFPGRQRSSQHNSVGVPRVGVGRVDDGRVGEVVRRRRKTVDH